MAWVGVLGYLNSMKKLTYIVFFLLGCSVNPALFKGRIDYLGEPEKCQLIASDSFVGEGVTLEEVKEESERYFKRVAIKEKANYIHVYEHYPIHINAKNPTISGMYYLVKGNIYLCRNS